MIQTITNSSRCTFLDCQLKFFFEYIVRLSPKVEPIYFAWGHLVHKGLELLARDVPVGNIPEVIRAEIEELATQQQIHTKQLEQFDQLLTVLPGCLGGYLLKRGRENLHYEELGIEKKFELELPHGRFKGKIDRIVRDDRSGLLYIWEVKTAAQTGESFWRQLPLDSQPKGYVLAAQRALGLHVEDVIYDILKKPQLKQGMYESVEEFMERTCNAYLATGGEKYFERGPINITQQKVDAYFWELDQVLESIQWHEREGIWVPHHPRNRKGGCAFQGICMRGEECEPLKGRYDKFVMRPPEKLHPELTKEEK